MARDPRPILAKLADADGDALGTPENPMSVAFAGAASTDREVAGYAYRVKTAFAGAAVGNLVIALVVLNVSTGSPAFEGQVWFNSSTASALVGTPDPANLEAIGLSGLTAAQLAAMNLNTATPGEVVTATPVLDTAIHASGDTLFDRTLLANAVKANGERAILQSVTLVDKDDQGAAVDLFLLEADVLFGAVNAPPSITDANAVNVHFIGSIAAADWIDLGGNRVASLKGIGLMVKAGAASRDLWIAAVTRGTPTHTAAGIVVKAGFVGL